MLCRYIADLTRRSAILFRILRLNLIRLPSSLFSGPPAVQASDSINLVILVRVLRLNLVRLPLSCCCFSILCSSTQAPSAEHVADGRTPMWKRDQLCAFLVWQGSATRRSRGQLQMSPRPRCDLFFLLLSLVHTALHRLQVRCWCLSLNRYIRCRLVFPSFVFIAWRYHGP